MSALRQYQPSWIELKNSTKSPKQIRISAPAIYHPRIYKAIIKEKDMDTVYKFQLSEDGKKAKLSKSSKAGMLIIKMNIMPDYSIGLSDF